jgi:transcriptional regulator with XRE-family HTH domain
VDSIREVFSWRLKRLRGDKTQEEFSARLGIPLRSYQNMEAGNVPQHKSLYRLVEKLALKSETELFQDPDRENPKLRLFELVARLDENQAEALLAHANDILASLKIEAEALSSSDSSKRQPDKPHYKPRDRKR